MQEGMVVHAFLCWIILTLTGSQASWKFLNPKKPCSILIITRLLYDRLGNGYKEHIVATTDSGKGTLREITRREGFESFVIPAGVGGRYSVLTPVGLFSAAMSGIDITAMLDGAAMTELISQS